MKVFIKNISLVVAFISLASLAYSQAEFANDDKAPLSPHSIRQVRKADVMYNQTLWVRVDLREKMNEPFKTEGSPITKIIIDAVKAGIIRPYKNDSLVTRMSTQEFNDNLKIPGVEDMSGEDEAMFGGGGDDWGSDSGGGDAWGGDAWGGGDDWGGDGGGAAAAEAAPDEFFAKDMYILEIKENRYFDRKRGRMYYDIQSITVVIPGDLYPTGIEKPIATFSYKELVSNVFVDNPAATWFNPKNTAMHMNYYDAFEMRQFMGKIVKYANPKNKFIDEIYDGNLKLGLAKSQEFEYKLLEYESDLWSN